MVDRYVLHQRGANGDRCRCNCNSFRALVARGGISANCPQETSIGIRPVVAQARRKLALSTGTNWGGPSCYRAASRIALTRWTDGFVEAGAGDIGGRCSRRRPGRRRAATATASAAAPEAKITSDASATNSAAYLRARSMPPATQRKDRSLRRHESVRDPGGRCREALASLGAYSAGNAPNTLTVVHRPCHGAIPAPNLIARELGFGSAF